MPLPARPAFVNDHDWATVVDAYNTGGQTWTNMQNFLQLVAPNTPTETPAPTATPTPTAAPAPRHDPIPAGMPVYYGPDGTLVDIATGRPGYYGPAGEPGYATPQPGAVPYTMPDGRVAFYIPGSFAYSDPTRAPNTPTADKPATSSAYAIVQAFLDSVGLSSLSGFVQSLLQNEPNLDSNILMLKLRETPEYKARFIGNEQRRAAGLNVLPEDQYLAYEDQVRQMMRAFGMPPGFYDEPSDISKFIANDLSVAELQDRIQNVTQVAVTDPPEMRAEAQRLYGITDGDLIAYALDPSRALPLIQQRLAAVRASGFVRGASAGTGLLTATQAEQVAASGADVRSTGLDIAGLLPLNAENLQEPDLVTQQDIVDAALGSQPAQAKLSRRQRARLAEFGGSAGQAQSSTQGNLSLSVVR